MPATGTKPQKIETLKGAIGADEIDEEELEPEAWEMQMNELKEIVANLARTVAENISRNSEETPNSNARVGTHTLLENEAGSVSIKVQHSAQDIIGMLPEFDPVKGAITAEQFLSKVDQLQR